MIHSNVLSLVGKTPLVALSRMGAHVSATLAAKVELASIGGSVKDRVALAMVEAAEASGELSPGKVLIEATSGNTGIGLAMVCAVKGYPLTLIMPESASEERKRIMRAYGATLMLTPGHLATDGAIEEAYRLAREEPERYLLLDQYNNPACVRAHVETTAREIYDDTDGAVTHVVCTLGTTGTAMGLAAGLKELKPDITVIAVEPFEGHRIQGLKNMQESYPPGIWDKHSLDAVLRVEDEAAFDCARRLAREEGLLVGMSAGAACAGAIRVAEEAVAADPDSKPLVVFICPDSGERYLSTTLYAAEDEGGAHVLDMASAAPVPVADADGATRIFCVGPSLDEDDGGAGSLDAWRRLVLADILARLQRERGHEAHVHAGCADMDDRTLAAARMAGQPVGAYVQGALQGLHTLAKRLGLDETLAFVAASQDAGRERELAMVRTLLARGFAYEKLRSVYYDVGRDRAYGALSGVNLEALELGRTVDLSDYTKDNPKDFTLLKRATLADLKAGDVVETEWGNVRPSWFLQLAGAALASADSGQGSGSPTLVLSGENQIFPHLENFRAIWRNGLHKGAGVAPRAFAAAGPVVGPVVGPEEAGPTLAQLLDAAPSPMAVRMWLASTSRYKPLAATDETLAMWHANWQRLQELTIGLRRLAHAEPSGRVDNSEAQQAAYGLRSAITEALEGDLATHRAWPALFGFAKTVTALAGSRHLSAEGAMQCQRALAFADRVLGFIDPARLPLESPPAEVAELVERRATARAERDFAKADALRDELAGRGYRVEDAPDGPRVFTK